LKDKKNSKKRKNYKKIKFEFFEKNENKLTRLPLDPARRPIMPMAPDPTT
jgi:hypothetical protein